jgi:hypothetical protein
MTRRLHIKSKLFFSEPYVVRLDYAGRSENEYLKEHSALVRKAYKHFKGTWAHSSVEFETVKIKDEFNNPAPPGPGHFVGMTPAMILGSLFDPDYIQVPRAYFAFKDSIDALQFRLTIESKAIQVKMWPSTKLFTIHEILDES